MDLSGFPTPIGEVFYYNHSASCDTNSVWKKFHCGVLYASGVTYL